MHYNVATIVLVEILQHKYATSTHTAASEREPVLASIIINLISI